VRTLFLDRPRALVLLLLIVAVGGVSSLLTMPQEEDPKLTTRFATIITPYPGASAERVERLVTQPIEDALRELAEVDEVRSSSRTGISSVTFVLLDEVVDTEGGLSKARDALADAVPRLPAAAGAPRFIDDRNYAYTVLAALVWDGSEAPSPLILKRLAEGLQDRLKSVPGTEFTSVHGAGPEAITVSLDPDTADALGLDEAAIADALARGDAKGAAGRVESGANLIAVEVAGELSSLDRVRAVPLAVGGAGQASIGDVAEVRRGVVLPEAELAMVDGRRAVIVGTRMKTGLRVGQWSALVHEELEAFERDLSAGIELRVIFDQAAYAGERFGSLVQNLVLGIGLVVLILFATLGWRAALIVTLAIPLTALATLTVMNAVGIPIHQMSVVGMIVALGLLVDAAIVTCDAVARRLDKGLSAREAVAQSFDRLWLPLLSSTATTVLAFLPITLLPGGAGEFVGPIADSVIIALITSYVLALTAIAALAGLFLRPGTKGGAGFPRLGRLFDRALRTSLRRPVLSILLACVLPVAGFVLAGTLPSQFFPDADRNQFHVQLRLSPQSSLARTEEAARIADAILEADERVVSAEWMVGGSFPAFYYNLRMNQDGATGFAEAMVTARSLRGLKKLEDELQERIEDALPDAQVIVRTIVQGPPAEAPVELRITGPDLATLRALGERARLLLSEIPEVVASTASLSGGEPKLWIDADEAALREAGLTLGDLRGALSAKLQGARGGSVIEGETEVPVLVRLNDQARGSMDEVASATIEGVPVGAVGALRLAPAAAAIERFQGERVNTILAYVRPGTLPTEATERFAELAAERGFDLPYSYAYEFGGDAEARSDTVSELLAPMGVIVTALVGVLVLTFGSFRLGALVLLVAGLSMGLGMFCLWLFAFPFGFQPIIALMGLMGVAINAAIIILSGLKAAPEAVAGSMDAIVRGTSETTRHITSTTLTTFAGFLPLILSDGGFWPPFATAIAGGVVLSTIVSFFLVPQAFLLLTRAKPFDLPAPRRTLPAEAVHVAA
jgi:multidrug efflux pump subunit AcrB